MPGWRFKLWIIYIVEKHPWVQVRAGEIGVIVAQVGRSLPIGAKSAESVGDLSLLTDLRAWLQAGGQKGVQRPVLPPGSLMPVHPVGFLVITRERVYGVPVSHEFQRLQAHGRLDVRIVRLDGRSTEGDRDYAEDGRQRRSASTPAASSRRSKASRCPAAPSPAGSANSTTSRNWKAKTRPIRCSSRP